MVRTRTFGAAMTAAYEVWAERQEKATADVVAKRTAASSSAPDLPSRSAHRQGRGHDVAAWMGLVTGSKSSVSSACANMALDQRGSSQRMF
jgi:hypothetical protein